MSAREYLIISPEACEMFDQFLAAHAQQLETPPADPTRRTEQSGTEEHQR